VLVLRLQDKQHNIGIPLYDVASPTGVAVPMRFFLGLRPRVALVVPDFRFLPLVLLEMGVPESIASEAAAGAAVPE